MLVAYVFRLALPKNKYALAAGSNLCYILVD